MILYISLVEYFKWCDPFSKVGISIEFLILEIIDMFWIGPNAVKFIIDHSRLSAIVCSGKTFDSLAKASHQCSSMKTIILMDRISESTKQKAAANLDFYNLNDLINKGQSLEKRDNPVTPDDLLIIMYTSGTTGDPKVCISKTGTKNIQGISLMSKREVQIGDKSIKRSIRMTY